ncbi:MAG: hypothetical protein R6W97_09650 [Thiobacillus sp.]
MALTQALHQTGLATLLIDCQDRLFAQSSPRSLFDWQQQLVRGQMNLLSLAHGDGWVASGIPANNPALLRAAQSYDCVVFDRLPDGVGMDWVAGAEHVLVLAVQPTPYSMKNSYAVLKTLAGRGGACEVILSGEPSVCAHVRAACSHFLGRPFVQAIYNGLHEDHAFAGLAARMAGEETCRKARYKTGNT